MNKSTENCVYIGINGSGKTIALNEAYRKEKNEKKRMCFKYGSSFFPETFFNQKLSVSDYKKSFWARFEEFITELCNKEEEISLSDLSDKKKENFKELNEKINCEKNKNSSSARNLKDGITTNVLKENAEFKIKWLKKVEESLTITAKFNKVNFEKDLKNFLKESVIPGRGTGNYQYLLIKILFLLVDYFNDGENFSLFLDEPEAYMHPSMIRLVSRMLKKLGEKINLFVSTHSPMLVTHLLTENTKLFKCTKNKKELKEIVIDHKILNSYFSARYQLIKDLFAKKIFLIEGNNDLEFLDLLIEELTNDNLNFQDYNVHVCWGKFNISNIYKKITKNLNNEFQVDDVFVVYDKDTKNEVLDGKNNDKDKNKKANEKLENLNISEKNKIVFSKNIEEEFNLCKDTWLDKSLNGKLLEHLKKNKNWKTYKNKISIFLQN